MSDFKALTYSGGGFGGYGEHDDEDGEMKVPGNTKSLFFSSWMTRFGARTQRRGSLGFSDSHIGTPPSRLDDDSNSGFMEEKYPSGELEKYSTSKTERRPRKRNDSYSEVYGMTPGEDGDSYFLLNKFRQKDCDSRFQDAVKSSIHLTTEGLVELDITKPTESDQVTPIPTLEEGKVVINCETKYAHEHTGLSEMATVSAGVEKSKKMIEDNEGSIFLIDLEELEDSEHGTKILKPQSKKFSASSLFQNKYAQNWFFRKTDDDTETLIEQDYETPINCKDNDSDTDRSMFYKLKTLMEKNHSNRREMNVWQPQGM